MSTNCVKCISQERTGNDLLCDKCREEDRRTAAEPKCNAEKVKREVGHCVDGHDVISFFAFSISVEKGRPVPTIIFMANESVEKQAEEKGEEIRALLDQLVVAVKPIYDASNQAAGA